MKPLLLSLALLIVAGCASSTLPPEFPEKPVSFTTLRKGLTDTEVRTLLGEPAEIREIQKSGLTGHIWTYHWKVAETTKMVALNTREVPAINPRTGEATTVREPVYDAQVNAIVETAELLIYEKKLYGWKILRKDESHVDPF